MPLSRYGVLKGKVVGIDDSERTDENPHVKIIVKCENDNRRREIVVNAKSQESPNKVLYVVDENYESIRFEYIPKLKDGFTLIKSGNEFTNKSEIINNIDRYKFNSESEYNEFLNKIDRIGNISKEIAVDFIRKEVFNKCDMKILPHNSPGKNNDLFDFMINHMSKAMLKEANIYIYGEPYSSNNGMHNVHMNQGSGEGRFKKYNDIYQDGCIFLEFEEHWEAIFIAFQSQSWCTDGNGDVEKECYLYGHHTSRPTGICKKIDKRDENRTDFNIKIHFKGGLTSSQEDIIKDAADRWSKIIVGDLPSVRIDNEIIDDVLIEADGNYIDGEGGVLGEAGPIYLRPRNQNYLPALGIMSFDSSDLKRMEDEGSLFNVVFHEIGHILGFGTIWSDIGLVQHLGTANPTFTGQNAMREYEALTNSSKLVPVPVANTGGEGTYGSHWRENILGNELMTGFLNPGNNPISRLTIASMEDIGYQVNYNEADKFTIPSSLRLAELGIGSEIEFGVILTPEKVVLPESSLIDYK